MGLISFAKKIGGEIIGTLVGTTSLLTGAGKEKSAKIAQDVAKEPVAQNVGAIGVAATAAAAGAAVGTTPTLLAGAKSIGSALLNYARANPIKTLIAGTIVVPTIAKSEKLQSGISQVAQDLPKEVGGVSSDLAKVIDEPSLESAKELITQNPILSTVAGAAAVIGLGKIAGGTIATIANTVAVKENTEVAAAAGQSVMTSGGGLVETREVSTPIIPTMNPAISTNQGYPITPAVMEVSETSKKKRKKYSKRKQVPMINIKIDNREDNDVYDRKVYKGGRSRK